MMSPRKPLPISTVSPFITAGSPPQAEGCERLFPAPALPGAHLIPTGSCSPPELLPGSSALPPCVPPSPPCPAEWSPARFGLPGAEPSSSRAGAALTSSSLLAICSESCLFLFLAQEPQPSLSLVHVSCSSGHFCPNLPFGPCCHLVKTPRHCFLLLCCRLLLRSVQAHGPPSPLWTASVLCLCRLGALGAHLGMNGSSGAPCCAASQADSTALPRQVLGRPEWHRLRDLLRPTCPRPAVVCLSLGSLSA